MIRNRLGHVLWLPFRSIRLNATAAIDLVRAQPRPLLVYQMAKVGSTAVCRALEAEGLTPLHIHFLGKKVATARASYLDRGALMPDHMYMERLLRAYLRLTRHRLKAITLFRDPIAHLISSAYQTRDRDGYVTGDVDAMVERLTCELSDWKALEYCYTWFDDEIREVFGVDILAHPFDPTKGYVELVGPRADVLVLKLEVLDDLWPAIGSFVGKPVTPVRANVRTQEFGGQTYNAVRARLRLSKDHVERLYDHTWMRHFYSEPEIRRFVERWSAP